MTLQVNMEGAQLLYLLGQRGFSSQGCQSVNPAAVCLRLGKGKHQRDVGVGVFAWRGAGKDQLKQMKPEGFAFALWTLLGYKKIVVNGLILKKLCIYQARSCITSTY